MVSDKSPGGEVSISTTRAFFASMLELPIRLAGQLAALLGRDSEAVEMRLRGGLVAPRHKFRLGRRVRFLGKTGSIRIGHSVTLYGDTLIDARGNHGCVSIGSNTHIDVLCVLYGQGDLRIGAQCAIAAGTLIYTQTNRDSLLDGSPVSEQPTSYAAVAIERGCWIGAGARILPGVSVGEGTHIGAAAVVTQSLPSFCIAVGTPARKINQRPH